jgi:hypothetical protein
MITNKVKKFKIDIGNHPKSDRFGKCSIDKYDAILNLSDYPQYWPDKKSIEMNWYPVVEWDTWGYGPLYWTVNALDRLVKAKKKIYVHCWAVKHRSPMSVYLYIQSLGYAAEEAFAMFDMQFITNIIGDKKPTGNWLKRFYDADIKSGRIPKDAIKFMQLVRQNPGLSILQVLEILKGKRIVEEFNLSFEPKK